MTQDQSQMYVTVKDDCTAQTIIKDDSTDKIICYLAKGMSNKAEFIVKACNCHDELLEALEEIVDFTFNIGNEDNPDCYDAHKKAMRAIAKAKGE